MLAFLLLLLLIFFPHPELARKKDEQFIGNEELLYLPKSGVVLHILSSFLKQLWKTNSVKKPFPCHPGQNY